MNPILKIFSTPEELAKSLANEFTGPEPNNNGKINIALSGGSTPRLLFDYLSKSAFRKKVDWSSLQLFWGDERCVPPEHRQSNFGLARERLLVHVNIPEKNVYRIRGEADPVQEAQRYAKQIRTVVQNSDSGQPVFDWIFLGMGTDGHTASLFPEADNLYLEDQICVVARHPETNQMRITITLPVINNARRISILITGGSKSPIVEKILRQKNDYHKLPAAMVKPIDGTLEWYLDQAAAKKIL